MDTTVSLRDYGAALCICVIGVAHVVYSLCIGYSTVWRDLPLAIMSVLYLIVSGTLWSVFFSVLQRQDAQELAYALYQAARLVQALCTCARLFSLDVKLYNMTSIGATPRHYFGFLVTAALFITGLCYFIFVDHSEWLWLFMSVPIATLAAFILPQAWKQESFRPSALLLVISIAISLVILVTGLTIADWLHYPGQSAAALLVLCPLGSPKLMQQIFKIEDNRFNHEMCYLKEQVGELKATQSREPLFRQEGIVSPLPE